ncbi:hypothetical protein GUJ93_ZPchr0001g31483 [Zizania palustris]|uniref:Ubiquitin-like protease family profile domain-containing protein n=1 Tax=Zizania palustris TaxID=103762 RepID=A0A8J5VQH3_ZIZPA|nr:hypothetical protein GUJ93_ZPchr0001g31483 [Zizania palustris]
MSCRAGGAAGFAVRPDGGEEPGALPSFLPHSFPPQLQCFSLVSSGDFPFSCRWCRSRIPSPPCSARRRDANCFSSSLAAGGLNGGTVLAPCSKEYVSSRYCGIVSNVEELKGYNWAQFTLDFLINHLELFKTSKRTGLVGNLAFLQIWYFEHFQVADDCFDYGLHKRPLIASWGANKVAKRAQLEGVKKSGCAKVVIRLEADDGKVVTLSDNSEEVSHNDHNFEGSHNADDTLQWIKDKLIDFVNDTDSKFSTLLERIERLEDHSTLQLLNAYASIFNYSWEKDKKQVLIPMNTTNSHWWLCVVFPAKKELQVLDPLKRHINYEQDLKDLRYGIDALLETGRKCPPQMEYRCSCGIFTIKYMQYWDGEKMTSNFSQDDMETFRKKMPAELILCPLNEYDFVKDDVNAIGVFNDFNYDLLECCNMSAGVFWCIEEYIIAVSEYIIL